MRYSRYDYAVGFQIKFLCFLIIDIQELFQNDVIKIMYIMDVI